MMRNLSNHRAEETKEGYNWTSWQAEQLKALNKYKQENQKKFTKRFSDINRKITESIIKHRKAGATDQEIDILKAIKKGAKLTHKAENNRTEKNKTGKKEYFGTVCVKVSCFNV